MIPFSLKANGPRHRVPARQASRKQVNLQVVYSTSFY